MLDHHSETQQKDKADEYSNCQLIKQIENNPHWDKKTISQLCRGYCHVDNEEYRTNCPFLILKPNETIVDMDSHKKELEVFVMRPLLVKQSTYDRLEQMAHKKETNPIIFLENMVFEIYNQFFEDENSKCQK